MSAAEAIAVYAIIALLGTAAVVMVGGLVWHLINLVRGIR